MATVIYRKCVCGETAHHDKARKNEAGEWEHYYACRNCGAEKPVPKRRQAAQGLPLGPDSQKKRHGREN